MFKKYDKLNDHQLLIQLNQQRLELERVKKDNENLEGCLLEGNKILIELDKHSGDDQDDCEWKIRFENQMRLNENLQNYEQFLEFDFSQVIQRLTQKDERKIQILTQGTSEDAMNFNLEALNEKQLYRLMKHLERMQANLYNSLRRTEWKLDKTSYELQNTYLMRQAYQIELHNVYLTIIDLAPPPSPPNSNEKGHRSRKKKLKKKRRKSKAEKPKEEKQKKVKFILPVEEENVSETIVIPVPDEEAKISIEETETTQGTEIVQEVVENKESSPPLEQDSPPQEELNLEPAKT